MLRRLRRVPLPLGLLLLAAMIQALAWMVVLPPLQGPDEPSHFTYTQRIWERHEIPWSPRGGKVGPPSSEVQLALGVAGFGPLMANVGARPLWTRADERLWSREARGAPRGNSGYNPALRNPPLYYVYDAVPYGIGSGGTVWDRLLLTRLANVPLLLATLAFVWLLTGEILRRRRRSLQFVAAAAVMTLPQLFNVTATVNPDIALIAASSAVLYVIALIFSRGPSRRLLAWLVALNVVALLIQPRGAALLIPSAMAVLLVLARERGWTRVTPLRVGLLTPLVLGLASLAVAGRGQGSVREFGSYVWQFYLPKLGFMNQTIGPPGYGVRSAFVDRIFGGFADLEVGLGPTVETIAAWALLILLVGLVVALVVRRAALRRRAGLAVVLAAAVWSLLLGLHLVAYRAMVGNPADPIITGRYLLPLVALFGVAVAVIADVLPRRLSGAFTGAAVSAAVLLPLMSLGALLERFYG